MSQSAISRIRRAFALAPHRSQTFKLSTDPLFIDKVLDVVGLYLDPPEKALALCVDEKSQIQALDRSQPVLPMVPGIPERRSHDYVRAGTLFATKDPNGDDLPPYVAAPSGHFKGALITHNGDILGGDGLQDLVVRVGGKLWVYPGDGYGTVNIDRRQEILLPDGAPSPAGFTQIVAAGDITGDGRTDFLATVANATDDGLWAFTGYHGATVDQATRLSGSAWKERDIVTVLDVSGDGVADLVHRSDVSGRLLPRRGIAGTTGGVSLASLGSAAASSGGVDTEYGASGWGSSNIPLLIGTPDADGDTIPDIWTTRSNGSVRFHSGGRTALPGSGTEIVGPPTCWNTRIAIG
jgi:hypothetical protein